MKEQLEGLILTALAGIETAQTEPELLNLKSQLIGKSGTLTELMKQLKDLSPEDKRIMGPALNEAKTKINTLIETKLKSLVKGNKPRLFDITLPVDANKQGTVMPVTAVAEEVVAIMQTLGFTVVTGPEMEDDYHNFGALNIPSDHPARDMQDTYWLSNGKLLRTHTSPCQVRAMEKYGAPLRIVAPGRCFRNEDLDASHENTFFQLEGMVIDKNISIRNLIYIMKEILDAVFGESVDVRLRPGYFPFVEPGFELDIKCAICKGAGCPTCKYSGWLELLPCGMIHPNVLKSSGIDPEEYNGLAFGLGLTRLAMMKYQIEDIRTLNSGEIKKVRQFTKR